MAGGGSRRGDGPVKIASVNGFAALESLKKKKKSDKDASKNKGPSKSSVKEPEPPVIWSSKPLVNKSWADVEEDDDDDYYATTAPPQSVWGSSEPVNQKKEIEFEAEMEEEMLQESESEDGFDEGDDNEEEPEPEAQVPIPAEPVEKKPPTTMPAPKETERQLSKKELKKKGLEELDALLAELGIAGKDSDAGKGQLNDEGKKLEEQNGEGGKKESAPEVKTGKKKKSKKDKCLKEVKDSQEEQEQHQQPNGGRANDGDGSGAKDTEEDASAVDVKERLKKVVSTKKKKSSKEMDAAARAAAVEAAARSARLAAAKKKEKNHYNQQPIR